MVVVNGASLTSIGQTAPSERLRSSRLEQTSASRLLGNFASGLDRGLPVPLGVQLRGLIEYGIACGELTPGTRLPSVRELADAGGVAPMTVSGVYGDLREAGLIVTRPGSGTFVAPPAPGVPRPAAAMRRLERQMDSLLMEAQAAGLAAADLAALLNARIARLRSRETQPLRMVMVGVFREATEAYAAEIARHLKDQDTIAPLTIDDLRSGQPEGGYDLYVTLANRRHEVERLLPPDSPVASVSFIPAEQTRTRLAAIDPEARIGILSVFPEFLALMKPGVLRFTPHVRSVGATLVDDPELPAFLTTVDVVVYATGAERVLAQLPRGVTAIEYRHVPDPHAIQRDLIPIIERLRAGLPLNEAVP